MCEHKLGKVESDGYQYCTLCGLAIVALCKHHFMSISINNLQLGKKIVGKDYILKCVKCGEMKTYRSELDKAGYI